MPQRSAAILYLISSRCAINAPSMGVRLPPHSVARTGGANRRAGGRPGAAHDISLVLNRKTPHHRMIELAAQRGEGGNLQWPGMPLALERPDQAGGDGRVRAARCLLRLAGRREQ